MKNGNEQQHDHSDRRNIRQVLGERDEAVLDDLAGVADVADRRKQRGHNRQADGEPRQLPAAEEEVVGVLLLPRGPEDDAERHQQIADDGGDVERAQPGVRRWSGGEQIQ